MSEPTIQEFILGKILKDGAFLLEFNQLLETNAGEEAQYIRACRLIRSMEEYEETVEQARRPVTLERWTQISAKYLKMSEKNRAVYGSTEFVKPAACYCEEAPEEGMVCQPCLKAKEYAKLMGKLKAKILTENAAHDAKEKSKEELWEDAAE